MYKIILEIHGLTEFLKVKTVDLYVNECFEKVGLTFYFCSRPRVMYLSQTKTIMDSTMDEEWKYKVKAATQKELRTKPYTGCRV